MTEAQRKFREDEIVMNAMVENIFVWNDKVREANKIRALHAEGTNVVNFRGNPDSNN